MMQYGRVCASVRRALPILLVLSVSAHAKSQGYGSSTPGGSGKSVYRVTSRSDSGRGTLRDAVSTGNRRVVFDVAGTIDLRSTIRILGSYITIDGTTAPSPGITLRGGGLQLSGSRVHDVVIRGLRIRDPGARDKEGDGVTIRDGAHDIVLEHMSIDGCGDGNLDITRGAYDVTVAWSVLSGCAKNVLVKYGARRVTMHHNVLVNSRWRNPWASNEDSGRVAPDTTLDMRNNLIWGWGSSGGGTGVECGAKANVVANYYSSPGASKRRQENALMVNGCRRGSGGLAYADGNVSGDDLDFDLNDEGNRRSPFSAAFVDTHDACIGARDALAGAGVDPLDSRDQRNLSGISIRGCSGGTRARTSGGSNEPKSSSGSANTLLLQVWHGRDDSWERADGRVERGAKVIRVGENRTASAFRFPDVTVPRGARILSARLRLYVIGSGGEPIDLRYHGEKAADSAPLATGRDDLSDRRLTSTRVSSRPGDWKNGGWAASPDLADVVQEIVDQNGWRSGNHLTVLLLGDGSRSSRKIATEERSEKTAARLEVRWAND